MGLAAAWASCALWWASEAKTRKDLTVWRPQSIQSRGGWQCSSPLHPGPSFRSRGMMGGGPEPLALILARVGCPHVLPSLHLLQTVLVHFPLGEDEEEDTTGEADGPRGGEMCTGFGEGPSLSQRSWGESHSSLTNCTNTAIQLASIQPLCWLLEGPTRIRSCRCPAQNPVIALLSLPGQVQTPRHGTKGPVWLGLCPPRHSFPL